MAVADEFEGASLLDSGTRATRWEGLLFLPVALWTPEGWGGGAAEPLELYSTAYLSTGVQSDEDNLLEYYNSLWVRARLPTALGFAPPTCRRALRMRFLDAALLAVSVSRGGFRSTPFLCTEVDLRAELRFGLGCSAARRRAIASAFWGLLASEPHALANYRDRYLYGEGHDLTPTLVGYWRGKFHLAESRR